MKANERRVALGQMKNPFFVLELSQLKRLFSGNILFDRFAPRQNLTFHNSGGKWKAINTAVWGGRFKPCWINFSSSFASNPCDPGTCSRPVLLDPKHYPRTWMLYPSNANALATGSKEKRNKLRIQNNPEPGTKTF